MNVWFAAALVIGLPLLVTAVFLIVDRKWSGRWWWD